jgi:small subunit ribosomal protein S8
MMTDPIADMLSRIRNAGSAGHRRVDLPPSKLKVEIARVLKDNHFVHDYKVLDDGRHGVLRLYLKYHDGRPIIRSIQRVSRPGRRSYTKVADVREVRGGMGIAILSTSQGVMTDQEARARHVGGEVLATVW